jgi:hypothetical protein
MMAINFGRLSKPAISKRMLRRNSVLASIRGSPMAMLAMVSLGLNFRMLQSLYAIELFWNSWRTHIDPFAL